MKDLDENSTMEKSFVLAPSSRLVEFVTPQGREGKATGVGSQTLADHMASTLRKQKQNRKCSQRLPQVKGFLLQGCTS